MSRRVAEVPAPAWECARLVRGLMHHPVLPLSFLEELRALLARYPARRILFAIEQACQELDARGQTPEWPDNGEADAYVALTLGLEELVSISQQVKAAA